MNKNTLLLSLVAIVTVALIYTLIESDEIDPKGYQISQTEDPVITSYSDNSNVNIEYEQSKTTIKKQVLKATKKEPKREKFLESTCLDGKRNFEISLINPNQDPDKKPKKYVNVTGRIDGNTFNLKIPSYLVVGDNSAVTLRIKNRKTDTVVSAPAYFLNDLRDQTQRHFVSIDSNDVVNYEYKTKARILPLPGSDTIEE